MMCRQTHRQIQEHMGEKGRINVTIHTLFKIAQALNVPLEEFFQGLD